MKRVKWFEKLVRADFLRDPRMATDFESAVEDITAHLTSERQAWLFGAGISCRSGLPLMVTLTEIIANELVTANSEYTALFTALRAELPADAHIEHILSHIGDLIALAERSREGTVRVGVVAYDGKALRGLHGGIRDLIREVIRHGYLPADENESVRISSSDKPVVDVVHHRSFVKTLFAVRDKAGRTQRAIHFFTLNYDTLLEDALALERISFTDGFSGGAMAYWSPDTAYGDVGSGGFAQAQIVKLHGSVDWHADADGSVIRCRDGCGYPARAGNVLIFPQSTKYVATQRDPFASLFERLRSNVRSPSASVLAICGYSFGDDHVNLEIEEAMARVDSKTVVIAFAFESEIDGKSELPPRLIDWLIAKPWSSRLFVLTNRGLYHGDHTNLYQGPGSLDWWTFEGVVRFLSDGPQQEAPILSEMEQRELVAVGSEQ